MSGRETEISSDELAIWAAERAIKRTLNAYCFCLDFNDVEGLVDVFTPEGEWHTSTGLVMRGHDQIRRWLVEDRNPKNVLTTEPDQGRVMGMHFRANVDITVNGDDATVVSYLLQTFPSGGRVEIEATGRYVDTMARCEDGKWRFVAHRTLLEAVHVDQHHELTRRPEFAALRKASYPVALLDTLATS